MTATAARLTITDADILQALTTVEVDSDAGGMETSETSWEAFGRIWNLKDLRPSEEAVRTRLVSEAMDRVGARLRAAIVEELLVAGVAFAAACPDAVLAVA